MTWYDNLKAHPRTFEAQERALTEGGGYATQLDLYYAMVAHACKLEDELNEVKKVLTEVVVELIDTAVL